MSYSIVACPICSAQNSKGISVCFNCGSSMMSNAPGPGDSQEIFTGQGMYVDSSVDRAGGRARLESLVKAIGFDSTSSTNSMKIAVPVNKDQRQIVHAFQNGQDKSGRALVSFVSVCGLASSDWYERCLRMNARLPHAAFAIAPVKGVDHLVVTSNQQIDTLDSLEMKTILADIASRAHALETALVPPIGED